MSSVEMRQNLRRGESSLNKMMGQDQGPGAVRAQEDNQVIPLAADMRSNGYRAKLCTKINQLLDNDKQVKSYINELNETNKKRKEMRDQLREFK